MPEAIRLPGYSASYIANMSTAMPTRVLAGVDVPSSPSINAALQLAREHLEIWSYNHVVRCWLLGTAIADRIPGLINRDRELHSIAALLHDLGGGKDQSCMSADKAVEVDSAAAACAFIGRQSTSAQWNSSRKQLLWDAIARRNPKQSEVAATILGIMTDFCGPEGVPGDVLSVAEWQNIAREFPRSGLRNAIVQKTCSFCRNKPQTTYDILAGELGEAFFQGYPRAGRQGYDYIVNPVDAE